MKILVAEDDLHTRNALVEILRGEGYETCDVATGTEAMTVFDAESPDLVCLDVMMPGASGYEVCRHIRKRNADVPVLFISAKSEEIDTVVGLEAGGDDYIAKPFGVREVLARIRAITRRTRRVGGQDVRESFEMGDLRVVPSELRVYRDGVGADISQRDMLILELLFDRCGEVVDRDTLMDTCWGVDYMPNSRALDQHMSQLRKRIEADPKQPTIILTVHGAGYRFESGS